MSDDEQKAKVPKAPLPLRASASKIAISEAVTVPRVVAPNDRPTPRSTVIPRLPAPMTLSGMRPQLETLIFHGAPPVAPATPPKAMAPASVPRPKSIAPMMLPPPMIDSFQDVHSSELLSDAELEDADRDTPYHEEGGGEIARTHRPPPIVIARRRREPRVFAIITAALAVPIAIAAFVFDHAPRGHAARVSATAPTPAATTAPPARVPGTCIVEGAPKLLARRALVRGGVESATLDDRVAFAALSSAKSGTAFELDARTLAVKGSTRVVASESLLHVVPDLGEDVPVDAQGDTGALRTIADADGDMVFGVRDGFAVWGPRDAVTNGSSGMARLWKLPWPQAIEAPRVVSLGTSGDRAVVFRRAGAIWIGSFRGGQTTSDLTKLSTAQYAGAPSLDARGDEAIVAWAQRDAQSPWGIRWTRWTAHAGPDAVHDLALPQGGPGDRAMAPSVAALYEGRFLLSWTEAGRGRNQVRAEVIDATDHAMGTPLLVSAADAVAGQETIALTDSGRGAIAYLVAKRGAFELRATAIDCAR